MMRCARCGNLTKIKKLIDYGQIEDVTMMKDDNGRVLHEFSEAKDMI